MDLIFLEWTDSLLQFIREQHYLGLFLLLTVEEAGVPLPLPGDTVVAYAGYLTAGGTIGWWQTLLVAISASTIGSTPLYWLARRRGRALLLKYGRYMHLPPNRLRRIEKWVLRRGPSSVLIGRLIPGMRIGTTAVAGTFGIPYWQYLFYQGISATIWWGVWLWLGRVLGAQLAPMLEFSPTHFFVTVFFVALAVAVLLHIKRAMVREAKGELPPPVLEESPLTEEYR